MLKTRIIPTLLFKDFGLVKGRCFDSWRRTGSALQAIKVYNLREVDEMVFLDITATNDNRSPDFATVDELADECFVPLAVGGGIKNLEDVRSLLRVGADKIVVGTAAVENSELISAIAEKFGSQCVVVAIDVKNTTKGQEVYIHSGKQATGLNPVRFAEQIAKSGAGEILLTSIDRDGTMLGYDIELIKKISQVVSIPVIASGGAGNYQHMFEAIKDGGAAAVAAASIFHFTEQTPLEAKRYLHELGVQVRL